MELNENLQAEIAAIFKSVQYGKITFAISPEKKTLDYTVETTGKLPIPQQQRSIKKQISIKKRLTAR
ncbi:MAG: hypothetical protein LBH28_06460, partial [Oscillospiraceae bacterium]|nr:hypothetical protein [Oscillospiraceae bacterium]